LGGADSKMMKVLLNVQARELEQTIAVNMTGILSE
jgi:hypothetical protein